MTKIFSIFLIVLLFIPSHSYATSITKEVMCMAVNLYHEARGESTLGKIAVGRVVLNRVADNRWPNSVCKVVFQGKFKNNQPVLHQCQFSWFCDGKSDKINYKSTSWKDCYIIARKLVISGQHKGILDGATYYHSSSTKPFWIKSLTRVLSIDNHIFYR